MCIGPERGGEHSTALLAMSDLGYLTLQLLAVFFSLFARRSWLMKDTFIRSGVVPWIMIYGVVTLSCYYMLFI